jgi:hypothetical protein
MSTLNSDLPVVSSLLSERQSSDVQEANKDTVSLCQLAICVCVSLCLNLKCNRQQQLYGPTHPAGINLRAEKASLGGITN